MTYFLVYFSFYCLLLVLLACYLFKWQEKLTASRTLLICATLVVVVSVYFGFRGIQIGSDTSTYANNYIKISHIDSFSAFLKNSSASGILFDGLFYLCHGVVPIAFLFTFFSLLFFTSFILFLSVRFKEELLPLLINLLGFFTIISLNINVIRIGFALSFFFLFLYFNERKKWQGWLFLPLAILVHVTILIIILPYFLSKWIKPILFYYALWLVALLFAIKDLGLFNIPFVKNYIIDSPHFSYYLSHKSSYRTGFRLDFTIFNLVFIILGFFAYQQKEKPYYFKMYLLLSALFLSLYAIIASDRIGLFSWILIPLILRDFSELLISGTGK